MSDTFDLEKFDEQRKFVEEELKREPFDELYPQELFLSAATAYTLADSLDEFLTLTKLFNTRGPICPYMWGRLESIKKIMAKK
jgi:hypothetical protein